VSVKLTLELAKKTGIAEKTAVQTIERIATVAERFGDFVGGLPIGTETLELTAKAVKSNRARLI
jgi:hypothetical protein